MVATVSAEMTKGSFAGTVTEAGLSEHVGISRAETDIVVVTAQVRLTVPVHPSTEEAYTDALPDLPGLGITMLPLLSWKSGIWTASVAIPLDGSKLESPE